LGEEIWRRLERGRIRFRFRWCGRSRDRSHSRWDTGEIAVESREKVRREEEDGGDVVDEDAVDEEEGIEGKSWFGKDGRIEMKTDGCWESEIEEGRSGARFRRRVGDVEEEGNRLQARSFERRAWVGCCRKRTGRDEDSWGIARGDGEIEEKEEEEEGSVARRTTTSPKAFQDRTLHLLSSFPEMMEEDLVLSREVEILLLGFQTQRFHRSAIASLLAYPPRRRRPRRSSRRHSVVRCRFWGWKSWKRA